MRLTRRFLLYWTLVSALRRNHWGMGRFWREALARRVLVRKVFWEGCWRGKHKGGKARQSQTGVALWSKIRITASLSPAWLSALACLSSLMRHLKPSEEKRDRNRRRRECMGEKGPSRTEATNHRGLKGVGPGWETERRRAADKLVRLVSIRARAKKSLSPTVGTSDALPSSCARASSQYLMPGS